MNSDWYIDKGYTHKICEDYVVVGNGFAIVSDGCSASKHTDIGARVLCMSARELLLNFLEDGGEELDHRHFGNHVIGVAYSSIQNLGLPLTCLDATLLVTYVHRDRVRILMYGDGYAIITFDDGKKMLWKKEYPQNAPYYLSYQLDYQRQQTYCQQISDYQFFHTSNVPDKELQMPAYRWIETTIPVEETVPIARFIDQPDNMRISNVLIMSDGVASFLENSKNVDDTNILEEFTNFKVMKGEFVRRRCNAVMKRFAKDGVKHYDDISVAGIHLV
jgi:hypothetical protein